MSNTEFHTGKLKIKETDLSPEDFKKFVNGNKDLYVDDWESLEDENPFIFVYKENWHGDYLYVYNNTTLYAFISHTSYNETEDVDVTIKNGDTIDFAYMFYNGGTWFGEMLQDGLNSAEKK